jgi:hypothetical protein
MSQLDPKHPWTRLTAAARQISDERDTSAPYGFSTRVVARAFASELRSINLLERFSLRAVAVAGLLALASVAVNYSAVTNSGANVSVDDEFLPTDDAVSAALDFSD